jgi:nucleotide-binding universal stress UspA family protein
MKTILAATDFSKPARNAINYAFELARKSGAKLILFHAYQAPVIVSEMPLVVPSLLEIEENCTNYLKKIRKSLLARKGKKVQIGIVCFCGFSADEIYLYTLENKVDLVVMGMQGAGYLKEKIMGSVTTDVIRTTEVPVLTIGEKIKFKNIKKIVLASDGQGISKMSALKSLEEIQMLFKSKLFILNVVEEGNTHTENAAEKKLKRYLKNAEYVNYSLPGKTIVESINDFTITEEIDLIVMIPRTHALLDRIFNERKTKQMAFHTSLPLLTIHADIVISKRRDKEKKDVMSEAESRVLLR